MSDQVLRALERAATSTQSPDDVLRWAAELDRVGRPDDALEALCRARADARVRAAIVARPASPGPALVDAPVERFRVKLAGSDQAKLVAAGPLGVVVGSKARTRVLDPETGETRLTLPGAAWHAVLGDVVLRVRGSKPATLEAHDIWTGELLHSTALTGKVTTTWVGPSLVISGRGALQAYAFTSPRRAPEPSWQMKVFEGTDEVLVTEDRALVRVDRDGRFGRILESGTGQVVRDIATRYDDSNRGVAAWLVAAHDVGLGFEACGAPGEQRYEETIRAFSLRDGRELWSRPSRELRKTVLAPGRAFVIGDDQVVRLDATTGAELGAPIDRETHFDPAFGPATIESVLPGSDVDYLIARGRGDVLGWRRDGRLAWRWGPRPSLDIVGAAATRGRLYLALGRCTIVCLDRPGS